MLQPIAINLVDIGHVADVRRRLQRLLVDMDISVVGASVCGIDIDVH